LKENELYHLKKYGLFLLFAWPQWLMADEIDVTMHYVGTNKRASLAGSTGKVSKRLNLQGGFFRAKNIKVESS